MAVGGDIQIKMTVDSNEVTYKVTQAGQVLRTFQQTLQDVNYTSQAADVQFHKLGNSVTYAAHSFEIMKAALLTITGLLAFLPKQVMDAAGELERMQVMMRGLSDAPNQQAQITEAAKWTRDIMEMAQKTPFGVKALTDSFIKLKEGGIDPLDGTLKSLTDGVARFGGSSEVLKSATLAIEQMAGKGVVAMQELRQQLGQAIPSAVNDMALGLGISMSKLTKLVSSGTLEAKSAIRNMTTVMEVEAAGASERMMGTWNGMIEQFKTKMTLFMAGAANPSGEEKGGMFGQVKDQFQQLLDWMDSQQGHRFGFELGEGLQSFVGVLIEAKDDVIQFRSELELAAEVIVASWAANKLMTGFTALKGGYDMVIGASKARIAAVENESALRIEALKAEASAAEIAAAQEADAEAARARASVSMAGEEVQVRTAALREYEMQFLASQKRMAAAMVEKDAALRRLGPAGGKNIIAEQERLIANEEQISAAMQRTIATYEARIAVLREAMMAETQLAAEMLRTAEAARIESIALTGINTAELEASNGAKTLAGSMGALEGVWNLMGGWVGAVTAVLIAGMEYWEHYGGSAADAIKKIKDAVQSGTANEKDLADTKDALKKNAAQTAADQAAANGTGYDSSNPVDEYGRTTKTAKQAHDDAVARLAQDKIEHEDLVKQQGLIIGQIQDHRVQQAVALWQKALDKENVGKDAALNKFKLEEDKRYKELANEPVGASEAAQKAHDDRVKAEATRFQQELIKRRSATADELTRLADAKNAELEIAKKRPNNGENVQILEKEYNMLSERAHQAQQDLQRAIDLGKYNTLNTKAPKNTPEDPLNRALAEQEGALAEAKAKLAGLSGDINSYNALYTSVVQKVFADIKAGKYQFKGVNPKLNEATGDADPRIEKLINAKVDTTLLKDNMAAITQMTNKAESLRSISAQAMEQIHGTAEKETAGMRAINKEYDTLIASHHLAEIKDTVGSAAAAAAEKVNAKIRQRIALMDAATQAARTEQATIDSAALHSKMDDKNKDLEASAETNPRLRIINETTKAINKMREAEEAQIATNNELIASENKKSSPNQGAINDLMESNKILTQDFQKFTVDSYDEMNRKLETPMDKLARQWADTTTEMQDATAKWAQDGVNAFMKFAQTGKFSFTDLVNTILADLLKIQAQKNLMPALQSALSYIPGFGSTSAGAGAFSGFTPTAPMDGGSFDLSGYTSPVAFAKGGIMTEFGSLELKKYANGGVASSPQLAMFGEGASPEAYVPLPDGRSIPVTMRGGQQASQDGPTSVQVNIINQTGVAATAQATPSMNGQQMVLDIVLAGMQSPGGFRTGMIGAMK